MIDVYQIVTDRIIEMLEKGEIPWEKPWQYNSNRAYNIVTDKEYSVLNNMLLREGGAYATFKQWSELGGKIKKGAKSKFIVFWKMVEDKKQNTDNHNDDSIKHMIPILRYYNVFHISQVEGLSEEVISKVENRNKTTEFEIIKNTDIEEIMNLYYDKYNIKVENSNSDEAYYSPILDEIHLPEQKQFRKQEEYYSTKIHETVHSTGHRDRLDRDLLNEFGSKEYAKEELVAEIGAATLMNMFSINTENSDRNSAAYVQSWIQVLKNDKKMIVAASGKAEKAVNMILNKQDQTEEEKAAV